MTGRMLRYLLRDAAALAVHPFADAALLNASARFCAAEIEWRAANLLVSRCEVGDPNEPALEAEADRLSDIRDELLDPVLGLPCTTLAGAQAVAQALAEWDQELLKDASDYTQDKLTVRLVSSLLAMPGSVPPPPPPGADAEVLATAAEFQRLQAEAGDEGNPQWGEANDAKWRPFRTLADMVPVTEVGHRAKAAVAASMLQELHEGMGGCPAGQFAARALQDWLGRVA